MGRRLKGDDKNWKKDLNIALQVIRGGDEKKSFQFRGETSTKE